jgi:acylphosphatase
MTRCVVIKGRVQGVGFRYWVLRQAQKIGDLSGYACNLANGDVAVLMSGPEENLDRLQALLYHGPLFARVDSVQSAPEQIPYFPPIVNGVFKRI